MTTPMPDIELPFYTRHTPYEISINPNDTHQLYKTTDSRLNVVIESMRRKCLVHLAPCASYTLVTEVSEPRMVVGESHRPRIHFHGIITFKNPIKFLTEHLHHLAAYASIQINPYRPDYWPSYITKQKDILSPELGKAYYLSDKDTSITPAGHGPEFYIKKKL